MSKARVLWGTNNLFTVQIQDKVQQVRIKGKILKGTENDYNPLASGDWVDIDDNQQIVLRYPRHNFFQRFNWKLKRTQTLVANADLVFCVMACQSPPFHARFLDRLLIACMAGQIRPHIIVNKCDLWQDDLSDELAVYKSLGYPISLVSIYQSQGLEEIKKLAAGQFVAFIGASGVGKSSLFNALLGQDYQQTGEVNKKFNRGNHTTSQTMIKESSDHTLWCDTPGMRDFTPSIANRLDAYYPDFSPYLTQCLYEDCLHCDENDCAVKQAIAKGKIKASRYQGYLKILEEEALKEDFLRRYSWK